MDDTYFIYQTNPLPLFPQPQPVSLHRKCTNAPFLPPTAHPSCPPPTPDMKMQPYHCILRVWGEVFTVPHINPLDSTGFLWVLRDSCGLQWTSIPIYLYGNPYNILGLDWTGVLSESTGIPVLWESCGLEHTGLQRNPQDSRGLEGNLQESTGLDRNPWDWTGIHRTTY